MRRITQRVVPGGVSKNEALAEWGGAAVVFGLVVEVVLTAAFRHGESIVEAWGPVFADILIALGVTAEILFARKARSKSETLQLRSAEKVAEANARAAEAEQKAADARERTAEIERLTAWRRVSPEQHSQIADAIRVKAKSVDVLIEYERGDPEAFSYARELTRIFVASGVEKIRVIPNSWLSTPVFGLHASIAPEIDLSIIVETFANAGIQLGIANVDLSRHLPRNVTAPNLYFFVAPKLIAATKDDPAGAADNRRGSETYGR